MWKAWLMAGVLMSTMATPSLAAADCTDNWSDMASAIAANSLVSAKDLRTRAASSVGGNLIKISLCHAYGTYSYQLVFLDQAGKLTTMTVDARNPFPQ